MFKNNTLKERIYDVVKNAKENEIVDIHYICKESKASKFYVYEVLQELVNKRILSTKINKFNTWSIKK